MEAMVSWPLLMQMSGQLEQLLGQSVAIGERYGESDTKQRTPPSKAALRGVKHHMNAHAKEVGTSVFEHVVSCG